MTSKSLAEKIANLSLEKKSTDVIILNIHPLSSMTDYFVICTGSTNTQVKAIADHISRSLKNDKIRPLHIEGYSNQEWVLLDYVNVIVHVFQPHKREHYALERLWGDAEMVEVTDD